MHRPKSLKTLSTLEIIWKSRFGESCDLQREVPRASEDLESHQLLELVSSPKGAWTNYGEHYHAVDTFQVYIISI